MTYPQFPFAPPRKRTTFDETYAQYNGCHTDLYTQDDYEAETFTVKAVRIA